MSMASATKKINSPIGGGAKKIGGSSGISRASWNPVLEKSLVVLLHEHNNTCFRDKYGWSSEAWNRIVKEFLNRNRYVCFTRGQIQEKERELKRDYKMLKEARRQSECTWNEDRSMIEGASTFWDNLIITFPKAKKFRNNKSSFPLFDELRELYDGQLAEGIYNCTSNESLQDSPLRQIDKTNEIQDLEEVMVYDVEDEDTQLHRIEDEDESSERNEHMVQRRADSLSRDEEDEDASGERNGQQRRGANESTNREEKEAKGLMKSVMAARDSSMVDMIRRGSLKMSMTMASATKKKNLPKGGGAKKIRSSPEGKSRAYWNPALEKSLVVLLHEHNNTCFRDKCGWSSAAWNSIVKEFLNRNKYVSFTRGQIQEKEQELKRDYKMLKEARRQSGCTWNEDRCMIEGGPTFWDNLINKFPKAKKFRNNKSSFPLFVDLRDLHDGHLAEGFYNFTSNESRQDSPLRQVDNTDGIQDLEELMVYDVGYEDTQVQRIEDEDASSERNEQMVRKRADSLSRDEDASIEKNEQQRRAANVSRNREEKEAKRLKKSGNVEGLMARYLEMRTKQVEDEAAQVAKIKEAAQGTDFSIKKCASVLNAMEVRKEVKAKAYAAFKNQDNREIFLSACSEDPESAMIWLRNEIT